MSDKLMEKEMSDELMVYDRQQDALHVLNPTARMVYRLYRAGKNIDEIQHEIEENFTLDADAGGIRNDIEKCIESFKQKGLV